MALSRCFPDAADGAVLIAEPDCAVSLALRRALDAASRPSLLARTAEELARLRDARLDAAILEAVMPDGCCLDLAAALYHRGVRVLVLSHWNDTRSAQRADSLGLPRVSRDDVLLVLDELLGGAPVPDRGLLLEDFARRFHLTRAEQRVLIAGLVSTSHDYLRSQLGVAEGTLKSQIAAIVGKAGADCLEDCILPLRRALLDEHGPRAADRTGSSASQNTSARRSGEALEDPHGSGGGP